MASARGEPGFTLVEVLVVVVIISILVSIGIPKYFRIVERARLTQAEVTLNAIRSSQERYFTSHGVYVTDIGHMGELDISLRGGPPRYGMKDFLMVLGKGDKGGCGELGPSYSIYMIRLEDSSKVISRYFNNYLMRYERCSNKVSFPGCPECTQDFMRSAAVQKLAKDAVPPLQPPKPPPPPPRFKDEDVKRLRRSLESMDIAVRRSAVEELAAAVGPEPIALLGEHLRSEIDAGMRREIVQACARKSTAAVACLTTALRDYEPEVRLDAVNRLRDMAAGASAPALVDALFDQEVEIRRGAISALRAVQQAELKAWQERQAEVEQPEKLFKLNESDRAAVARALAHAGLTE